MRTAAIEVFRVDCLTRAVPGDYPVGGTTGFEATIVRLARHDGIEGGRESTACGSDCVAAHARIVRAGIAEMADTLLGLDLRYGDRINDAMDAA